MSKETLPIGTVVTFETPGQPDSLDGLEIAKWGITVLPFWFHF